jgi:hypothetical protein
MSRALAISSCLELGETNQASEFARGFKEPTARWAQWASAMMLRKQYPAMNVLPREGNSFWRKIDWKLFNELTSAEKPPSN